MIPVELLARDLIDSIPAPVLTRDATGALLYLNKSAREFSGVTSLPLHEYDEFSTIHPDDRNTVELLFRNQFGARSPFDYEHRGLRFDGTYRWLSTKAHPVIDGQGAIQYWYCLMTDIHDRKMLESTMIRLSERLTTASQAQSELADISQTAGDIANTFSAMWLTTQAATRYLTNRPQDLGYVHTALERMNRDSVELSLFIHKLRAVLSKTTMCPLD